MHIALISISNWQLVSFGPSCLLGTLLSSWSSLSWRSPVGRWLPFYSSLSHSSRCSSRQHSFLRFSCCSNSCLRWVSCSTASTKVYIFSFQGVGGVPYFLVDGSHWMCLDHATLCLRNGGMANHLFLTNGVNWWYTKIVNELLAPNHANGYKQNKNTRTKQKALAWY